MDSALATVALPLALGIIMFGLGLDLTVEDFRRVGRHPKAVAIALGCQLLLLPAACFGLVLLFGLPPLLAIGLMLLAASPGGTSANLFSHLFRGDVALNVTLTAINSIVAVFTLPIVTNLAIAYFEPGGEVTLQFRKVVEVFVVVLGPVAIGMFVRDRRPGFAAAMDRPVRIGSAVILAVLVLAILLSERDHVVDYLGRVGLAAALFCALSLAVGYYVPRIFGISDRQAIASSMEIGVHNATLAIYIAVEVLGEVEISIPAAVYSLFMFVFAAIWGWTITKGPLKPAAGSTAPSGPVPS